MAKNEKESRILERLSNIKENDGTFTMSESISFDEYTLVVDSNPSEDFDNAYYPEWQEQHKVSEMLMEESRKFNIELIDWLISNPGSYLKSDLEYFKKILDNIIPQ